MEKIRLSKDEKILLRALQMGDMETPLLSYGQRYLAACSLSRKGLVDLALNYDKIESIKMTYECKAYMQANPSLKNPVDWFRTLFNKIVSPFILSFPILYTTVIFNEIW